MVEMASRKSGSVVKGGREMGREGGDSWLAWFSVWHTHTAQQPEFHLETKGWQEKGRDTKTKTEEREREREIAR